MTHQHQAPPEQLPLDLVEAEVLDHPADGLPPVTTSPSELETVIRALAAGSGPIAVDAERAHGFRYSQRAYLIQLRRTGAGTHLVDPIAFGMPADLSRLGAAIADTEWVIHAASQDLPCLYEVGLVPKQLFDTELAARLLNYPRVSLGTMLADQFGIRLLKEHSAADWSSRPIPDDWLNYAALDVELLVPLRDELAAQLVAADKWEWAQQEFAALVASAGVPAPPRADPWRRTSGIHKVRSRRQLAYVAELWSSRDDIARRLDRAPGRILPDIAITDLAAAADPGLIALRQIPAFTRRQAKRFEADWLAAIRTAATLRETDLPAMHRPSDGPPQPRLWAAKDPAAAARLTAVRQAVGEVATANNLPSENLIVPEHLRRLAWRPPEPISETSVDAALAESGARLWQRQLTVPAITAALTPDP